MADPPTYSDSREHTDDLDSITGTPRWAKVFGSVALVVVLVFFFQLVTEGPMRPGMPGMGGHGDGGTPPSSVVAPDLSGRSR